MWRIAISLEILGRRADTDQKADAFDPATTRRRSQALDVPGPVAARMAQLPTLTRRRLLGGGAVIVAAAAVGGYGRYALGDEMEGHVAGVLGVSEDVASHLLARARGRLSSVEYDARAAAFVAATTFPGAELMPTDVRERAVRGLLREAIASSSENIVYLGLQRDLSSGACTGLVKT
jgi:hypothetical protein